MPVGVDVAVREAVNLSRVIAVIYRHVVVCNYTPIRRLRQRPQHPQVVPMLVPHVVRGDGEGGGQFFDEAIAASRAARPIGVNPQ